MNGRADDTAVRPAGFTSLKETQQKETGRSLPPKSMLSPAKPRGVAAYPCCGVFTPFLEFNVYRQILAA